MKDLKVYAIYLGVFVGPLSGNAVLALIPSLKSAFGVDVGQVLLSIPFFMFPFAFLQLFSGTFSDLYDRKRIVVLGYLIYAFGSFLCGMSNSIAMFLISRTILGIGFALVSPVLVAILGDITSRENRGRAMGFFGSAITAGIASGPLVAGFLAEISWRYAFFVFSGLSLLAGGFFWSAFRGHSFQKTGGSLTDVLPQIRSVIHDRNVALLSMVGFLVFFAFISVISFMSDFLSLPPLLMKERQVGVILASSGIAGIIASPFAGAFVDRIGRKATATYGFLITVASLVLLTFAGDFYAFVLFLFLFGCGTAFIWSSLLTISVEIIPNMRGTVSSVFNSARFFGYAIAPTVLLPVYTSIGISVIYLVGTVIAIVCILLVRKIEY
ncbi:MAG: MFS transporter [Candidatus Hydrothermarchaeaceae archaeon]